MTGEEINLLALAVAKGIMCKMSEEEVEDISLLLAQIQCNLAVLRKKKK